MVLPDGGRTPDEAYYGNGDDVPAQLAAAAWRHGRDDSP